MVDFIKKYWFVLICSVVFLVFLGAYITGNQKETVSGKQVDGKDIVFSVGDKNISADDLYAKLEPEMAKQLSVMKFERLVIENGYKFSEDEKAQARIQAKQYLTNNRAQYGKEKADAQFTKILNAMGYQSIDDLENYFLVANAQQQLIKKHIEDNKASLYDKWAAENKPRLISHILIQTKDTKNPTKEIKDLMNKVDEELKTKDFKEVAKAYSQDQGSAQNGGYLGSITTTKSQFVKPFLDASLALESGKTSDWVASEFGFHKIYNAGSDFKAISADPSFLETFMSENPTLRGEVMMKLASEAKVDYSKNPEFEQQVKEYYGLVKKGNN